MNRTVTLIVKAVTAMLLITVLMIGVYYGVSYFSSANKMAQELKTGNEYMNAQEYTMAIEAYNRALDYEPENEELRNAIANAYVMLGKKMGDTDESVDAYQQALLFNRNNKNAYWGIAEIFEGRGEEENVLSALNTGYENTGDEAMKSKADFILAERARIQAEIEEKEREEAEKAAIEEAHNAVLKKLYDCFATQDIDAVKELLRTEEFVDLSNEIINEGGYIYYGDKNEAGDQDGKGVAVYYDGYYYYGNYKNNMRSGEGIWIRAVYSESSSLGSYVFEGTFADDKPNGKGKATSYFYKDKISNGEFLVQEILGEYVNGLEEGVMSLSGKTKKGTGVKYSYTCSSGIAEKSSKEDSGIKGQYIIATASDGKTNLTSDGSVRGVEGFVD